jgi:hypothetical protein
VEEVNYHIVVVKKENGAMVVGTLEQAGCQSTYWLAVPLDCPHNLSGRGRALSDFYFSSLTLPPPNFSVDDIDNLGKSLLGLSFVSLLSHLAYHLGVALFGSLGRRNLTDIGFFLLSFRPPT